MGAAPSTCIFLAMAVAVGSQIQSTMLGKNLPAGTTCYVAFTASMQTLNGVNTPVPNKVYWPHPNCAFAASCYPIRDAYATDTADSKYCFPIFFGFIPTTGTDYICQSIANPDPNYNVGDMAGACFATDSNRRVTCPSQLGTACRSFVGLPYGSNNANIQTYYVCAHVKDNCYDGLPWAASNYEMMTCPTSKANCATVTLLASNKGRDEGPFSICCPDAYQAPPSGNSWGTCSTCPGGYSCTAAAGTTLCLKGSYCPPGSSSPTTCPLGNYCPNDGMSSPLPCSPGQLCPAGTVTPGTCPVGFYCPIGETTPRPCPAGFYCPLQNQVEAFACPPGTTCPASSLTPFACDAQVAGSCAGWGFTSLTSPTSTTCDPLIHGVCDRALEIRPIVTNATFANNLNTLVMSIPVQRGQAFPLSPLAVSVNTLSPASQLIIRSEAQPRRPRTTSPLLRPIVAITISTFHPNSVVYLRDLHIASLVVSSANVNTSIILTDCTVGASVTLPTPDSRRSTSVVIIRRGVHFVGGSNIQIPVLVQDSASWSAQQALDVAGSTAYTDTMGGCPVAPQCWSAPLLTATSLGSLTRTQGGANSNRALDVFLGFVPDASKFANVGQAFVARTQAQFSNQDLVASQVSPTDVAGLRSNVVAMSNCAFLAVASPSSLSPSLAISPGALVAAAVNCSLTFTSTVTTSSDPVLAAAFNSSVPSALQAGMDVMRFVLGAANAVASSGDASGLATQAQTEASRRMLAWSDVLNTYDPPYDMLVAFGDVGATLTGATIVPLFSLSYLNVRDPNAGSPCGAPVLGGTELTVGSYFRAMGCLQSQRSDVLTRTQQATTSLFAQAKYAGLQLAAINTSALVQVQLMASMYSSLSVEVSRASSSFGSLVSEKQARKTQLISMVPAVMDVSKSLSNDLSNIVNSMSILTEQLNKAIQAEYNYSRNALLARLNGAISQIAGSVLLLMLSFVSGGVGVAAATGKTMSKLVSGVTKDNTGALALGAVGGIVDGVRDYEAIKAELDNMGQPHNQLHVLTTWMVQPAAAISLLPSALPGTLVHMPSSLVQAAQYNETLSFSASVCTVKYLSFVPTKTKSPTQSGRRQRRLGGVRVTNAYTMPLNAYNTPNKDASVSSLYYSTNDGTTSTFAPTSPAYACSTADNPGRECVDVLSTQISSLCDVGTSAIRAFVQSTVDAHDLQVDIALASAELEQINANQNATATARAAWASAVDTSSSSVWTTLSNIAQQAAGFTTTQANTLFNQAALNIASLELNSWSAAWDGAQFTAKYCSALAYQLPSLALAPSTRATWDALCGSGWASKAPFASLDQVVSNLQQIQRNLIGTDKSLTTLRDASATTGLFAVDVTLLVKRPGAVKNNAVSFVLDPDTLANLPGGGQMEALLPTPTCQDMLKAYSVGVLFFTSPADSPTSLGSLSLAGLGIASKYVNFQIELAAPFVQTYKGDSVPFNIQGGSFTFQFAYSTASLSGSSNFWYRLPGVSVSSFTDYDASPSSLPNTFTLPSVFARYTIKMPSSASTSPNATLANMIQAATNVVLIIKATGVRDAECTPEFPPAIAQDLATRAKQVPSCGADVCGSLALENATTACDWSVIPAAKLGACLKTSAGFERAGKFPVMALGCSCPASFVVSASGSNGNAALPMEAVVGIVVGVVLAGVGAGMVAWRLRHGAHGQPREGGTDAVVVPAPPSAARMAAMAAYQENEIRDNGATP